MKRLIIPNMSAMIEYLGMPIDAEPVLSLIAECERSEDEELGRIDLCATEQGFDLIAHLQKKTVETIFLYGPETQGTAGFAGDLIEGIAFGDSQRRIRTVLGMPTSSGLPGRAIGFHGGWDRYDRPQFVMHFAYTPASLVLNLVTLMTPTTAPRTAKA